jgi:hypothetical protein
MSLGGEGNVLQKTQESVGLLTEWCVPTPSHWETRECSTDMSASDPVQPQRGHLCSWAAMRFCNHWILEGNGSFDRI